MGNEQQMTDCHDAGAAGRFGSDRSSLADQFRSVRRSSIDMCKPLSAEEYRIQPIAEVSPPWWNLGHTSWFFARNVLRRLGGEYLPLDEQLDFVLNSYYVSLGERLARNRRGWMTRPTTEEIYAYRQSVDQRVLALIDSATETTLPELAWLLTIGMQHEQQHQELFYTEIKYILAQTPEPLRPAYRPRSEDTRCIAETQPASVVEFKGGLFDFGNVEGGWCWDNELPVHKYFLDDFALANRPVTNAEFLEFVDDGGYDNQLLWLDNGWNWRCREAWKAPLYWRREGRQWLQWTLGGTREVDASEPLCHVSFYEADAFARWKAETYDDQPAARLPTEREWEHAARSCNLEPERGHILHSGFLHPRAAPQNERMEQMFGDVWEWTASYYEPYPGYRPFPGNLTEYNSKFMDNQRVLRGGSCVTPAGHLRRSYRNFWSGETRFQFSGFRLAFSPASS
jgi:ergothioneine biosynthesis protein EgtB